MNSHIPRQSVALINMPLAGIESPSIQCGLLAAGLQAHGHESQVLYMNLEFAAEFGSGFTSRLTDILRTGVFSGSESLIGEWLFSKAAFDELDNAHQYSQETQVSEFCAHMGIAFSRLCSIRNELIISWIDRWTEDIAARGFDVVGFSCSFTHQSIASFALAKRLKKLQPSITIVFGGYTFSGEMGVEYVRALDFIDYAVVGEGDVAFPLLVDAVALSQDPIGISGVIGRRDGDVVGDYPAAPVENMDQLPDPDYDDYFETMKRPEEETRIKIPSVRLTLETSRGCWWGEKQQCTFCGLKPDGIQFRAKGPDQALRQMDSLSRKYAVTDFDIVDNIMANGYLTTLCERLIAGEYDFKLFYEVKANLTRDQLRTMSEAGIKAIQPGIESMSSRILKLMRKGVTMLENVRCLKWSRYYGIAVAWNILTGFPGETEADYDQQLYVLRCLRHLQPPSRKACTRIMLTRFSPYFTDDSFPVRNRRPLSAHAFVYPENTIDIDKVACVFTYEMGDTVSDEYHAPLKELIDDWHRAWSLGWLARKGSRPSLTFETGPGWLRVMDRREGDRQEHRFTGPAAFIYEACSDSGQSLNTLRVALNENGISCSDALMEQTLEEFCARRLMLKDHGRYLSLALPENPSR